MANNSSFSNNSTPRFPRERCDPYELQPDWIFTAVPPYIYSVAALGIPLNLLVLLVFLLHKKTCTAAEIYLSNMAAADLFLVMLLPFWGKNTANEFIWIFGGPMCKIVNLFIIMNYNCSVYFLVLVSIDRFLALVYPLSQCRLRRRKYAKISCALVWCFGLILNVPTIMCRQLKKAQPIPYNETHDYDMVVYECVLKCSKEVYAADGVVQFVVAFVIPLLIIAFCTVKIIKALKERPREGVSNQKSERKVTVLVLAVLLAFLICWLPFRVLRIVEIMIRLKLIRSSCLLRRVVTICNILFVNFGFFNSDLNPVLYVIVGKNFRKKMWEVLKGRGAERKSSSQSTTNTTISSVLSSVKLQQVNVKGVV